MKDREEKKKVEKRRNLTEKRKEGIKRRNEKERRKG
jgi:hypothetical protein